MSSLGAITEHTYTLSNQTQGFWSTGYFPVKKLSKSFVEYILAFNTRTDRYHFYRATRCFAWQARLANGICNGSIPVDLSIRNAVRKLFTTPIPMSPLTKYEYYFPKGSQIVLRSGKAVDVSGIQLDLTEACTGHKVCLNYFPFAGPVTIARALEAIGNRGKIYNLPLCIVGGWDPLPKLHRIHTVVNEDKISKKAVQEMFIDAVKGGYTEYQFVLAFQGFSSLVSINKNPTSSRNATLTFYDSFSPRMHRKRFHHSNYGSKVPKRYDASVVAFIQELLPPNHLRLGEAKPHVVRIMDQGNTEADGYYALYTALLLTRNAEKGLLDFSFHRKIFEDPCDGMAVRADLIVRTLLAFGLDKVKHGRCDGVFNKISAEALQKLIEQLRSRV